MSRHAAPEDERTGRREMTPRQIRGMAFAAIIAGVSAGTAGLVMAGVYWTHDELITPKGWVVVAGTTIFALGCFLGPIGLGRARDREHQTDAASAVEELRATAALIQPAIEPLLAHADLSVDLGELAKQIEHNGRFLIKAEEERAPILRAALQTMSQMRRMTDRMDALEASVSEVRNTQEVFKKVLEVVVAHALPRQGRDGEGGHSERDAVYLADLAEAVALGREMERRGKDHPPGTN